MTPPRAPRRLSWAIAGRVARGVAVAFVLVWLLNLVVWPVTLGWCPNCVLARDWRKRALLALASEHKKPPSRDHDELIERYLEGLRELNQTIYPCEDPEVDCPIRRVSLSLLPDLLGM